MYFNYKDKKVYYEEVKNGELYIFEHGGHPAMLSSAKEFSNVTKELLKK